MKKAEIPVELAFELRVLLALVRDEVQEKIKEVNLENPEVWAKRLARVRESDGVLMDAIIKALDGSES